MAIIGGAVLPLIGARLTDASGGWLNVGFFVPLIGYVVLTVFAIAAARTRVAVADVVAAPASH
jgi:FHS family L-fucose permease-like MFS transporter